MRNNAKQYNLKKIYERESPLQRYMRLIVGENSGIGRLFWQEALISLCGGIPGIIGWAIRNRLYSLFFRKFDKKCFIGRNVTLRCADHIHLCAGVVIDDFVQLIANSNHPEAIYVGEGTFFRSFAMVNAGPPEGFVRIGKNSSIGQGTLLYGNGGLLIGDNVLIAGQCSIIASSHNFENPQIPMADQGYNAKGIEINENVWIGTGARILDGVKIGKGAIVGANSVVNKSIGDGEHVGGVPAKRLYDNGSKK